MGDWLSLPLPFLGLWAQATAPSAASTNPTALAPLALRRWCGSLTLSSPGSAPGLSGLTAWLAGLGLLLLVVLVAQGPGRALRQVFDLAGHARVAADTTRRLKRSGRMLAVLIGTTVLSWTGSQAVVYDQASGRDDLLLLTRSRSPGELAFEQGVLAALTPLRDVAGLASNLPLLALATVLLFRATAESWGASQGVSGLYHNPQPPGWASVGWVSGALYLIYRIVSIPMGSPELPLGGCLTIEGVVIPAVMVLADGTLLAWLLSELRHAGFEDDGSSVFDVQDAAGLMPGAALASLAALPARYVATGVLLSAAYLPQSLAASPVGNWVRWQLSWGLADLQGAALLFVGVTGAVAWTGGSLAEALYGYGRVVASQGGRLVALLALSGIGSAAAAGAAYFVLLSLPAASWVLGAADSYAHYLTLPFGLWTLSALVELSERSLPEAALAPLEDGVAQDGPYEHSPA